MSGFAEMSLADLRGLIPAAGRPAVAVALSRGRDLLPEDLPRLAEVEQTVVPPIKRLRTQHHQIARLVASGAKDVEAAIACGYTATRVMQLKQDPAFQELIAYYSAQKDAIFQDIQERLAGAGTAFVEELQERLEENPEQFTNKELLAGVEVFLDRSSAPPKSRMNSGPSVLPPISISFHSGPGGDAGGQVLLGQSTPLLEHRPEAEGNE